MAERERLCLFFGIVAGLAFLGVPAVLGVLLPHYDPIAQTLSEIGKRGSPFEGAYRALLGAVAICLGLFSYGVYCFSSQRDLSPVPAILIGFYSVMALGVAIFESPHPLHNMFGISSMLGLLAPVGLAVSWPFPPAQCALRRVSGVAAVLVVIAIALNLLPLFVQPALLREHYGLVQRAMFLVFYGWCIYLALTLLRRAKS